jgi:hypothetical protein
MLEHINQHTVANDVRMRAITFAGAFVLVEGRSDQKLYIKFVDGARVQVLLCISRDRVIEAIRILNQDGFARACGIIDADFDRLEARPPPFANVFFTDAHDAEMMILNATVVAPFEALISEFASPDKLGAWQATFGSNLLDHLTAESAKIGALLLYSMRTASALDFGSHKNPLAYSDFASRPQLVVELTELIRHVHNRSGTPHAPVRPVQDAVEAILQAGYSWRELGRGRDLLEVLGVALRYVVGTCNQIQSAGHNLETHLRVAYSRNEFVLTALYHSVNSWATATLTFQVFV